MITTYSSLPNKLASAVSGIDYAYRDAGQGAVPLVRRQHFRGNLDNWDSALIDALASTRRIVAFDNAGSQERERIMKRTDRSSRVAAQQQHPSDTGILHHAPQEIARFGEAAKLAGDDMRHGDEPGALQPRAGGHHVGIRRTRRRIHEHRRAWLQQLAQPGAGEFVARRQFDRACADQVGDPLLLASGRGVHQPESRLREMT